MPATANNSAATGTESPMRKLMIFWMSWPKAHRSHSIRGFLSPENFGMHSCGTRPLTSPPPESGVIGMLVNLGGAASPTWLKSEGEGMLKSEGEGVFGTAGSVKPVVSGFLKSEGD